MNASDLELPPHLYTAATDPDSGRQQVMLNADKLIAWSEQGGGDAVDSWCRQFCDRELDAIDVWEDNRILELEEEWMSDDKDVEDEDEDEDEHRYHLACEAVAREAASKRAGARERLAEHKAAIERRVREARDYAAAHKPPPEEEEHWFEYLLALAGAAAVAFVLLT